MARQWTRPLRLFSVFGGHTVPERGAEEVTVDHQQAELDEAHRLVVCGPRGEQWEGFCQLRDHDSGSCHLRLKYNEYDLEGSDTDYFEALCRIREALESRAHTLRCYGASKNVFPSGMARNMGAGLKAYKLRLGQPARTADLVPIFGDGPDVEPASVAEQRAFYESWILSLRA